MRKYFLLSAVALMAATSANATTDYAEVTAKATIEVAGTFTCDNINWGTIVVKQNNKETYVDLNIETGADVGPDVLSYDSGNNSEGGSWCDLSSDTHHEYDENIRLTSDEGNTMTAMIYDAEVGSQRVLSGKLNIPANVKAGTYTGSFIVTATY